MSGLALEVVTPLGVQLAEEGLDRVVLRRREAQHESGSLISVYPSHAPMLVRTPEFSLVWNRGEERGSLLVGPGVAEVYRDRVTVLAGYVVQP